MNDPQIRIANKLKVKEAKNNQGEKTVAHKIDQHKNAPNVTYVATLCTINSSIFSSFTDKMCCSDKRGMYELVDWSIFAFSSSECAGKVYSNNQVIINEQFYGIMMSNRRWMCLYTYGFMVSINWASEWAGCDQFQFLYK